MTERNHLNLKRIFLRSTLTSAIVISGWYFHTQIQEIGEIIFQNDPLCSEIIPNSSSYGSIAVFGGGVSTNEEGVAVPNAFQVLRLKAAAEAYVIGYSDNIILVDGGESSAINKSITILQQEVSRISEGALQLPLEKIVFIHDSVNSADNISDLTSYMVAHHISSSLGITDLFHFNRMSKLAEAYNSNVTIYPTECLSNFSTTKDLKTLTTRNTQKGMQTRRLKEMFALIELVFDPQGKLTILLKELLQSR